MTIEVDSAQKTLTVSARPRGFRYTHMPAPRATFELPASTGESLNRHIERSIVWFLWKNNLTDSVPDKIWNDNANTGVGTEVSTGSAIAVM